VEAVMIPANYDAALAEPERCGWLDDEAQPNG
jgi:hypothetical protein